MDLLVLGGTAFLGRATVEEALRRGHRVTTFNRGRTGPDLDGVRAIRGDRTDPGDLDGLRDGTWDAVVDTSGYVPKVVGASARLLAGRAPAYAYVSSVSASGRWPAERAGEEESTFDTPADAGPDDGDYGQLKAGCERAVEAAYGGHALLLRPGLILGPHEDVGRLPWWLTRMSRGGRVLAPGDPAVAMQLVDVRDIAAFTLDALERGTAGLFDLVGPRGNTTFGSLLADCVRVTGSGAELVWAPDRVLLDSGVEPWTELPLWMPLTPPLGEGFRHVWDVDADGAEAAGLHCRPVAETVRDTWEQLLADGVPTGTAGGKLGGKHGLVHGIDPDKERAILASLGRAATGAAGADGAAQPDAVGAGTAEGDAR